MTKKLYWEFPYETKFTAKVLDIKEKGIVLDKTLFYPESGNQLSDRGTLRIKDSEFRIKKVTKKDSDIVHHISSELKNEIEIGNKVEGEIEWYYRYGLMRAHSSQHVFSAVLKNKYDIDTIRATLNFEEVFLQSSQKIDYLQLKEVLYEVNKIFTSKNSLIKSKIITYNEAKPKASEVRGVIPDEPKVRFIEIMDLDLVCCGGTHVQNTTEIGNIFIYDFKKGNEIKYYVGNKAILNSSNINVNIINLANSLNISLLKLREITKKRFDELEDIQNQQKVLSYKFLEALSKSHNKMIDDTSLFYFDFDIDIKIINKSLECFPQNSIIIGKIGTNKLRILSLSEKLDANKIIHDIIRLYHGKGGGNARSAQAALEKLPENLLSEIEKLVKKELTVK